LGISTGIGGPAPAAYVADLDLPGGRGLSLGIFRTMGDVGMSIGPVLLGWISDHSSYGHALWTNALMFFAVSIAFWLFARETAARRQPIPELAMTEGE
jgi:MFS family permease